MNIFYDVPDRVNQYGSTQFYEMVRDHICSIVEFSGLEFGLNDSDIQNLYQRYAHAYIIGVAARSTEVFSSFLIDEVNDPISGWEDVLDNSNSLLATNTPLHLHGLECDGFASVIDSSQNFPYFNGTDLQHTQGLLKAFAIFDHELSTRTGLASTIMDLIPGIYQTYYGDTYNDLVVVCQHETLSVLSGYL